MKKLRFDFGYILTLLISLTVALLIGAGILAITGHNPLAAYRALLGGALPQSGDLKRGGSSGPAWPGARRGCSRPPA